MKTKTILSLMTLMITSLSATAAHATSFQVRNGILTDDQGRTLYVYDEDPASLTAVSACQGGCLHAWPVALSSAISPQDADFSEFSTFTRPEGAQLVYDGRRLYYYVGDATPGDRTGDGLGGVWHVIVENQ